jgi:heat shock protein HslJ
MKAVRVITVVLILGFVLCLALCLAGCGSSGGSGGKIENVNWDLRSYDANGTMTSVPSGVQVTALFKSGRVTGSSGVNTYQGTYKLSGTGDITISKIATTLMAGPPEAMAVEQAYVKALEKAGSYTVDVSGLSLFAKNGTRLLSYEQGKTVSLTSSKWDVTSFFNGASAVTGVMSGTSLTAEFGSNGTLKGSTGVNEYQGSYKVDGSKITITDVKTTTGNQNPTPGVMQQEAQFLAALPLATKYTIKADRLDLLRSSGSIAVTMQAK